MLVLLADSPAHQRATGETIEFDGTRAGNLTGAAKLQMRFLVARIYHNVSNASVTRPGIATAIHSGLMPADLMTFAHLGNLVRTSSPSSCGVLGVASSPCAS